MATRKYQQTPEGFTIPRPEGVTVEDLSRVCATIGNFLFWWNLIEHMVDSMIYMLYEQHGGKSFCKRWPSALAAKIRFLRDCMNKIPAVGADRDRLEQLLIALENRGELRHAIAHGAVLSYNPLKQEILLARFDSIEGPPSSIARSLTPVTIQVVNDQAGFMRGMFNGVRIWTTDFNVRAGGV